MIEVKHLRKDYGSGSLIIHALNDLSFAIPDGKVVTIMGKSGSGKSTLLRLLGVLDRPTSGEIWIDNQRVDSMHDSRRAQLRLTELGYIFQEYALLPELTAVENVYLPALMLARPGVHPRQRALDLLRVVGLEERTNHLPKELSGGEQQRVAIARAMINTPKYLFADEPTANLDTASAEVVMQTFVKLNQDTSITVIFVSHDPDDKQYASTYLFLKDGSLVEPYF